METFPLPIPQQTPLPFELPLEPLLEPSFELRLDAPVSPPVARPPARPAPPQSPPLAEAALEELHPALWRAHQLGRQREHTCASGFDELDAELPGAGWPHRALTELMLPHPGVGELRLLAPALAAVQRTQRPVLLFDPPALPCAWTCQAVGLDLQQLVLVRSRPPRPGATASLPGLRQRLPAAADLLWTLEQTLASGHAGAVLAWLPASLGGEAMRRLQLAAQAHDGPAFVLRDVAAQLKPSVAPLRLLLAPAAPDGLALRLIKRRGPPLARTLRLELAAVLSDNARQRSLLAAQQAARPTHGRVPA